MKIIYLNCGMGAAGDMLSAALYELLDTGEKDEYIKKINSLGLKGVIVSAEPSEKCGIAGTHFKVTVGDDEEESVDVDLQHEHNHEHTHGHIHTHDAEHSHNHEHTHEHSHDHNHEHEHTREHTHITLNHVLEQIDRLPLSKKVKKDISGVYSLIAQAEAEAHRRPVGEVHFHEVGRLDAIADVAAVALAFEMLSPDKVIASPVHVGSGMVRCAHGILPVPAPATANLLRGIPSYSGEIKGELCTPTGAALLKYFVDEFGAQPVMSIEKTGYGMGKKDFPAANCVRAMMGFSEKQSADVLELKCNLDDMTPEAIGFAFDRLLEAGALDVFTQSIMMKKNRPAILLTCICCVEDENKLSELMLKHTTSLGVRVSQCRRHTLERKFNSVSTEYGDITMKVAGDKVKPEYSDVSAAALRAIVSGKDVTFSQVSDAAMNAYRREIDS